MTITIRRSTPGDLQFLEQIEAECFPVFQRSTRRTLRTSLSSSFQEVWIAEKRHMRSVKRVACLITHIHPRTLRLYSLGVLPSFQGLGLGERMMNHAINVAFAKGCEKISLEALSTNIRLVNWYKNVGFKVTETLRDYYAAGIDAERMVMQVALPFKQGQISNLIVVDHPRKWHLQIEGAKVVSSRAYISDNEFQTIKNIRVFNLSNSYRYQTTGYYVSLLASAREHRAIPSVTTIRDFSSLNIVRTIADDIDDQIQELLKKVDGNEFHLEIYFGETLKPAMRQLGQKLYQLFETPLLQVVFTKNGRWSIKKITPLSIGKLSEETLAEIQAFAQHYFGKKRFQRPRLKHYKYDLAILINPEEPNPPSCAIALKKFKDIANEVGFYVEFITNNDFDKICEFDALFIRETTNVNDMSYQISRKAYAEGLVVIDDPWSILRCSNKIYLAERMKQNKVLTPETIILSKNNFKNMKEAEFTFPMVLKQPDSAFSIGVVKVADYSELKEEVTRLFKKSELIIGQAFLKSDFDWRIGVLDQQPLFACKYYMAKGHWQIYNWNGAKEDEVGESETIAVEEVPEKVIRTAIKAASLMGDGLYGVDLKQVGDKVYLIEVNDNPNIDADVEDLFLKDQLYKTLMQSMFNKIELARKTSRLVAIEPD